MKFTKKRAMVVSLTVSLIAILSFSTLAWFNAKDDITNKFMIADSDSDGTPDFSVDVWETDVANEKTQEGVVYENILPGDVIAKNPTVENTGDYDQWIRVHVTFNNWSVIKAACENYKGVSEDLTDWLDVDDDKWEKSDNPEENTDTITYTYYLKEKLVKNNSVVLFTQVEIPKAFVQKDMAFADGYFNITVKAEAIQADNTGTTAQEAFEKCWTY